VSGSKATACEEQALASRGTGAPTGEASPANTASITSTDPGFDWGAAAIGAGAALGLMLLGSMIAIALTGRGRIRLAR
jgi:hypothetical protein